MPRKQAPHVVDVRSGERNVYVGRPTKFGNPFLLHDPFDMPERQLVLEKYREWLLSQPELVAAAKRELRGRNLGCWCAPLACHADVLLEVANAS
jgi:hypothetical protein